MDREFLEKNVIPYHQFFRADLPEPLHPDKKYDFDLSQLKVRRSRFIALHTATDSIIEELAG